MKETCRKAGRIYWIGFFATMTLGLGLMASPLVLAEISHENQRHQNALEVRTRTMQAVALGIVSWRVQHGSLPGAEQGNSLIEQVRRYPTARPLSDHPADLAFEELLRGPMKLTYTPMGGDGFSVTAVGPTGFDAKTIDFDANGLPATTAKGASDD